MASRFITAGSSPLFFEGLAVESFHDTDRIVFVPFLNGGNAETIGNPEEVLNALREVKVCDPACGSGAYLLGMMQDPIRLRSALFKSDKVAQRSMCNLKKEIIQKIFTASISIRLLSILPD